MLDNPIYWLVALEKSRQLAVDAGAMYLMIECVCPDRSELDRRLQARDAMESQPRVPLDLNQHPGAIVTLDQPRLTLDTTRPFAELVDEAVAYVEHLTPRPPFHVVERGRSRVGESVTS